jgi:hypothetical protein
MTALTAFTAFELGAAVGAMVVVGVVGFTV